MAGVHTNSQYICQMLKANLRQNSVHRAVLIWLFIGLVMVYLQIVIGGITRLTGSGLSITEWEIVTGTLPPMNDASWMLEFEKYKDTPQYEKINKDMALGSIFDVGTFKFIYFWEYLHRLWARTMGFVFIIPFIFFCWKKLLPISLIRGLGLVILLAILAATFGWIMVASGLINRPWVNAYKLAVHLCIGISVFIALWWVFIEYIHFHTSLQKLEIKRPVAILLGLLVLQIFLGGVMSGTKASLFINSWPDINGEVIPELLINLENWSYQNFNEYESNGFLVTLIQFFHRGVAYLISICSILILWKMRYYKARSRESISYLIFLFLLCLQIFVGIVTLVKSIGIIPVYLGVLHQSIGVLVMSSFVIYIFYSSHKVVRE